MGPGHLVHQALKWIPPEFQKKGRRLRMNWKKTLNKDPNVIDLTWSDATSWQFHSSACEYTQKLTTSSNNHTKCHSNPTDIKHTERHTQWQNPLKQSCRCKSKHSNNIFTLAKAMCATTITASQHPSICVSLECNHYCSNYWKYTKSRIQRNASKQFLTTNPCMFRTWPNGKSCV